MTENNTSNWMMAAVVSALVLVATVGSVIAIRERLLADMDETMAAESAAREKIAGKLSTLESKLDAMQAAPASDSESLAALQKTLSEINGRIDVLNARIEVLEKKPAVVVPEKPEPAKEAVPAEPANKRDATLSALKLVVLSGEPFKSELAVFAKQHPEAEIAALAAVAEDGVPSEAALARTLLAIIGDSAGTAKIDDTSTAGKLNTHLKGLVSIKKSDTKDAYSDLRKDAAREDIATLIRQVERLNETDRAPLAAWLQQAKQRRNALDALEELTKAGR